VGGGGAERHVSRTYVRRREASSRSQLFFACSVECNEGRGEAHKLDGQVCNF